MHLTIEITDQCSINYVHCSTQATPNGKNFILLEDILETVKKNPNFKKIRLSGGEPFLHPQILEIIQNLRKQRPHANLEILSSGTFHNNPLPLKKLQDLSSYSPQISFSIYGDETTHNSICQAHSYKNLLQSVRNASKTEINFSFQTVAMQQTKESLEDIAQYISSLKTPFNLKKLHLLNLVPQGRAKQKDKLSKEQEKEYLEKARQIAEKYQLNITEGCSFGCQKCPAGKQKKAITIQGEEIWCSSQKYSKQKKYGCQN